MVSIRWSQTTLPLLVASSFFGQAAESSPLRMAAPSSQDWPISDVTSPSALAPPNLIDAPSAPSPTDRSFDGHSSAWLAPEGPHALALNPGPPLLLAPLDSSPLIQPASLVAGEITPLPGESADSSATPTNHRIPEPGSYLLLLTGIIGLVARRRLRSRANLPDPPSEPGPS